MVNGSDKYLWLDKYDNVIESSGNSHPEAVTLLASPGGIIPGDVVAKYKLGDRIKPADPDAVQFDPVGNAIVRDDSGRAHAVSTLPEDDERRIRGEEAEAKMKKDRHDANRAKLAGQPVGPKPGLTVQAEPTIVTTGANQPATPAPATPAPK